MPNSTANKPVVYCTRSKYHSAPTFLIGLTKGGKQTSIKRYKQEKATLQIIVADTFQEANRYAQKWFGVGVGGEKKNE